MTHGLVYGPTFAEMEDPTRIPASVQRELAGPRGKDPLDPIHLFRMHWKPEGRVRHLLLDPKLTGVDANVIVLAADHFPTGSHKVGAVYSILIEKQTAGEVVPGRHTLVCPSTGNYGIGGAWVGPRMNYRSLVVLPEEMSAERFQKIGGYGAQVIKTPGSESNVKEIFDKVKELRAVPENRILEQFSEFGNYRFHWRVTGGACLEVVRDLAARGIGDGRVAAVVSAMGSSGTIACGDRVKSVHAGAAIVGVEPVECPTLFNVGFGSHRIEGIGDKHVTWIHNVLNMDLLVLVHDVDCLRGLQLLQEGTAILAEALGADPERLGTLVGHLGISGVCNVLGAIKAARHLGLGKGDNVVTFATDGFDRYPSVLARLDRERGRMTRDEALRRIEIFHHAGSGPALDGSRSVRERWHNQKYFTWVEQQGKTVRELQAQKDPGFWAAEAARADEVDARILSTRP